MHAAAISSLAIIHSGIDWRVFSVELRNICYLFWKFVALSHFIRASYGSRFIRPGREKRLKLRKKFNSGRNSKSFSLRFIWKKTWKKCFFRPESNRWSMIICVRIFRRQFFGSWVYLVLVLWKHCLKCVSVEISSFSRQLKFFKRVNCEKNTIFFGNSSEAKNIQFRSKENLYIRDHTCVSVCASNEKNLSSVQIWA